MQPDQQIAFYERQSIIFRVLDLEVYLRNYTPVYFYA